MDKEKRGKHHALFRVWINYMGAKGMLKYVRDLVRRKTYPKEAISIAKGAVRAHKKQIPLPCP